MPYSQSLPNATVIANVELDVVNKFNTLTEAALGTESIYMRAKDTFQELMSNSNITGTQYAELASQFIIQLANSTTQQVMQGALQWAQQEKEMPYALAKVKADTELVMANRELTGYQIDKILQEKEASKASAIAATASSLRENGAPTYDANGIVSALSNAGTKLAQQEVYAAQSYAALSDAYRKSGVVAIGTAADGVKKGLSGDTAGYTQAQDSYARRQIKSFEDSKRTHAANAASQTIGQLLATDIIPATGADNFIANIYSRYDTALAYLNTNTP